jgi:hypothetical protein
MADGGKAPAEKAAMHYAWNATTAARAAELAAAGVSIAPRKLAPGEAAMCATCCQFPNYPDVLLAVGIAVGLQFSPRAAAGGAVALYRFPPEGGLELLHRTPLDDAPTAIAPFHGGRLLLAVGRSLRLYDLGKRKLLRKCEASDFPNAIVTLSHAGDRIYAGDMQESVHFVRYKAEDNAFYTFADDTAPRRAGQRAAALRVQPAVVPGAGPHRAAHALDPKRAPPLRHHRWHHAVLWHAVYRAHPRRHRPARPGGSGLRPGASPGPGPGPQGRLTSRK